MPSIYATLPCPTDTHYAEASGTDRHAGIVSHASRLLCEAILLPRLVRNPNA
ncbi:hypothetical protein QRO11_04900 [Paracidovorax citrulli]|uniref:Uncharacterized protein n=1 Tax=Paracidovorax citrulli TaxID=80869 RepID=A0ABY9ASY5_PARCI|nr:hypothetical protein [Paracidovorax citrulli]UEG47172.1 hypothetical protein LKW27_04650 [Paracidovorax citrulli]WIY30363.1 hypothetical protein QRO09_01140 [Paracidovorax citrulli]WIY35684.1 hypothetical protein QRO11_04900 [Paracidovorax citrulli]WIY39584.1 hypothetical protein QRO10_01135 [Paracidovorax citrulli]WIY43189.1 hypothetical protein QRO12_19945 [Paracidovorax citrulli]